MRGFIVAVALLFAVPLFAQVPLGWKESAVRKNTTGAVWAAKAYANSGADTSSAVDLTKAMQTELLLVFDDSVDVTVSFLPSYDGQTYAAKVAIGSAWQNPLTSGVAVKGFQIPAGYNSCPRIKWVVAFTASANGVTTPTFTAKTVQKW